MSERDRIAAVRKNHFYFHGRLSVVSSIQQLFIKIGSVVFQINRRSQKKNNE